MNLRREGAAEVFIQRHIGTVERQLKLEAGRHVVELASASDGGCSFREVAAFELLKLPETVVGGDEATNVLQRVREAIVLDAAIRQPKLELRIGEPELALVDIAKVGSRLQVLDGNAELSSQLPERLDRRTARTRLDSRDVGV